MIEDPPLICISNYQHLPIVGHLYIYISLSLAITISYIYIHAYINICIYIYISRPICGWQIHNFRLRTTSYNYPIISHIWVGKNHRAGLHHKPSSVASSHRTLELEGCVIKVWPRWSQWLDSCPNTMTETSYWTVRIPIPFTYPIIFPCPVPISCTIWLD